MAGDIFGNNINVQRRRLGDQNSDQPIFFMYADELKKPIYNRKNLF